MSLIDPVRNFARVQLASGITSGATTMALVAGDGAELPDPATEGAFNLEVYNATDYAGPADDPEVEIYRVSAKSTDSLTVAGAQEGTTARNHNTAGKVYRAILAPTKKTIDDIRKMAENYFDAELVQEDAEGPYVQVAITGFTTACKAVAHWGLNENADPTVDYGLPQGSLFIAENGNGFVKVRANAEQGPVGIKRRIVVEVTKWAS